MHLYDHHGSLLRERDDKSLFTGCKNVEDASEELNPQKNLRPPSATVLSAVQSSIVPAATSH